MVRLIAGGVPGGWEVGQRVAWTDLSDEACAELAVSDRSAFGELYVRHRDTVFRLVRRRTGTDDEAADLSSLAFERALRGIGTYRSDRGPFVTWLLRIARNLAIDSQRRRTPWVDLARLTERLHPVSGDQPEESMMRAEGAAELRRHLDRLPLVQREALALRYGAGLTSLQIGLVIGKGEEATQKLLTRALATLKESMHEY